MEENESSSSSGARGVCLICQGSYSGTELPPPEETGVSINVLFQYLNVDVSKVVGGDFRGNDNNYKTVCGVGEEEVVVKHIASSTCGECSSLANTFGGIYQDYEVALQLLKECIMVLESNLKRSVTNLEPTATTTGHGLRGGGTLKAEILKKCELMLKTRPTKEPEESPSRSPPPPVGAQAQETHSGQSNGNQETSTESDDGNTTSINASNHSKSHQEGNTCVHCGKFLFGPFGNVKRHMMVVHTVQFFSDQLSPVGAIAQEEVDTAIQEIIGEGWLLSKKRRSFHCSYCMQDRKGELKRHLLLHHLDVLKSRLEVKKGGENEGSNSSEFLVPIVVKREKTEEEEQQLVHQEEEEEPSSSRPTTAITTGGGGGSTPSAASSAHPGIVEVATKVTAKTMRRRQRRAGKSTFHRNREFYKSANVKPPFPYAFLIRQAILESPQGKPLKVSEIVSWFLNFSYFRNNDNNSAAAAKLNKTIRKALYTAGSKKCFVRVNVGGRRQAAAWSVKDRDAFMPRVICSSARPARKKKGVIGIKAKSPRNNQQQQGRRFPCVYCTDRLADRTSWKRHLRIVHTALHCASQLPPETSQEAMEGAINKVIEFRAKLRPVQKQRHYCELCSREVVSSSRRIHVVERHFGEVIKMLEEAKK